ncbi:MAG: T9SS type A sorting domain-containing protein, partial [Bacteroidales bacterium]
ETGSKVFTIYSILAQDLVPENDTTTLNLDIIQSPIVDFGDVNGFLQVTLPHDLHAGGGHPSYLWQDSSTDSIYTVTEDGIYTVTVTGNNSCQTIKTVRVNIGSYIQNFTGKELMVNIYPNPTNDIINLEFDLEEFNDLKLEIINSHGQVVYNSKLHSDRFYNEIINISGYSKGIYYIKISNSELIHISKVIIF